MNSWAYTLAALRNIAAIPDKQISLADIDIANFDAISLNKHTKSHYHMPGNEMIHIWLPYNKISEVCIPTDMRQICVWWLSLTEMSLFRFSINLHSPCITTSTSISMKTRFHYQEITSRCVIIYQVLVLYMYMPNNMCRKCLEKVRP